MPSLLWGLYCASSWTWCIGMFLPIVLLEPYGAAGLLAFAIPNVLGCAAFGYLVDRESSRRLRRDHGGMMRFFSNATIAYHCFFVSWIFGLVAADRSAAPVWAGPACAGALLGLGAALSHIPRRAWPALGAAAWLASVAILVSIWPGRLGALTLGGTRPAGELAWLAPAMALGFLACPYLDLTFHRAREEAPSRHAFAAFGATFAVMLLMTTVYSWSPPTRFPALVLAHVALQSVFTVGAHLAEARRSRAEAEPVPVPGAARASGVAPLAWALAAVLGVSGFDTGRENYLRFLALYGLVFPAYVLVFVGPGRTWRRSAAVWAAFAGLLVTLTPIYEQGFLAYRTTWLGAGVAAILLAALPPRLAPRPRAA